MNMRMIIMILCCAEMVFFVGKFLYAHNGLPAILTVQRENKLLRDEIQNLKHEIITMEDYLTQWNRYPFYKEKIAREQLHMICTHEVVYFNI